MIVLPSHSRLSPPEGEEQQQHQDEIVPVVAFRENGLLKPLGGIEDIATQQGPGLLSFFTTTSSSSFFLLESM